LLSRILTAAGGQAHRLGVSQPTAAKHSLPFFVRRLVKPPGPPVVSRLTDIDRGA